MRFPALAALVALLLFCAAAPRAQVSGTVTGRVTEAETGLSIPGVNVVIDGTEFGRITDADGEYRLTVTEGRYRLRFSAVGYETVYDSVVVRRRQTLTVDAEMRETDIEIDGAVVERDAIEGVGVSTIDPRTARALPTPLADITRAVQTELGVTSNNELSNAFSVRGGSYDENQFFIDGFEIYRPLRIGQGEEEGLGLINGDLTDNLTLFAGGFPVRYGGKLASVLDATYARPAGAFSGTTYGSTLDAGAQIQGSVGRGVGVAVATRSARPQRFFASQELEGQYDPDFRDVQGVLDARLGADHTLRIDGLYARNRFRLSPQQRETTFGIFPNLVRTVAIDFAGQELDGYDIAFGGALVKSRFGRVRAEHRVSAFDTREFETLGVVSRTSLFRRQQRPEGSQTDLDRLLEGTTAQRDTANNVIDQTIFTAQGRYLLGQNRRHGIEAGWQARGLRFTDRIFEASTVIGRNVDGNPDTVLVRGINDTGRLNSFQGALWLDDAIQVNRKLRLIPGLRADYFAYNSELTLSPRLNLIAQTDTFTTITAGFGVYYQPPTYRELRGDPQPGETVSELLDGDIASQRATQAVVGFQRFFPSTRFSLRAEAYYKSLANLISYDVENIRVDYSGENDSEGYAGGFDVQLRGELVPGLESWVNYGFLVTKERFTNEPNRADFAATDAGQDLFDVAQARFQSRGGGDYIRRPTDRRHNLTFFVQDNVPGDDTWTLHIRTIYGTDLPSTAPAVAEVVNNVTVFQPGPRNQTNLPSYLRFDMGATKRLTVGRAVSGGPLMLNATVEVLNVFDQTNVVAQTSVEQTNREGRRTFLRVPTRLTPRTINVRFRFDF